MICISREEVSMTAEILSVMIKKEQSAFRCQDYLRYNIPNGSSGITEGHRQQLVDWCYAMTDVCCFRRETVAIAFGMFDRFLSIPSNFSAAVLQDESDLQLLAITSLYIAIKTNERVAVHSELFSKISEGDYSIQDIEDTEQLILWGLTWRVSGPTSLQMAMHILSLLDIQTVLGKDAIAKVISEVRFECEQAVRNYKLSLQRPSTVACSILFRTFQQIPHESLFEQLRHESSVELLTSLLSVVRAFDFDASCETAIDSYLNSSTRKRRAAWVI